MQLAGASGRIGASCAHHISISIMKTKLPRNLMERWRARVAARALLCLCIDLRVLHWKATLAAVTPADAVVASARRTLDSRSPSTYARPLSIAPASGSAHPLLGESLVCKKTFWPTHLCDYLEGKFSVCWASFEIYICGGLFYCWLCQRRMEIKYGEECCWWERQFIENYWNSKFGRLANYLLTNKSEKSIDCDKVIVKNTIENSVKSPSE